MISRAIIVYNRGRESGLADGVVITPSHNPPSDGGFKYNPPNGGPADTDITDAIQGRANELLRGGNKGVKRVAYEQALRASTTHQQDYVLDYVRDLASVVDMQAVKAAGIRIGIDPLGGAAVHYWEPVAELYGLNLTVVNKAVDPRFAFMTVDHDGKIRMDCSSPYAMASLVRMKDDFDIAFGNDPGRRPARNRHAQRGPAQPESLPLRSNPLSVDAPQTVERFAEGRQDAGFKCADRPRVPGAASRGVRGACRLQVAAGSL